MFFWFFKSKDNIKNRGVQDDVSRSCNCSYRSLLLVEARFRYLPALAGSSISLTQILCNVCNYR